jgi:hypothetical protein
MSPVPPLDLTATLAQWEACKQQLNELKLREHTLRQLIFGHCFPAPKEGTNTFVLPSQWQIKGKYPITRDIDVGALDSLKAAKVGDMLDTLRAMHFAVDTLPPETPVLEAVRVPVDVLVVNKPALSTTAYRTLTQEQRQLFDTCLVIKPGSPAIEIAEPAKKAVRA